MVAGLALSAPLRLCLAPWRRGRRPPVFQHGGGGPKGVSGVGLAWVQPVPTVSAAGPAAGAEPWPGSVRRRHI